MLQWSIWCNGVRTRLAAVKSQGNTSCESSPEPDASYRCSRYAGYRVCRWYGARQRGQRWGPASQYSSRAITHTRWNRWPQERMAKGRGLKGARHTGQSEWSWSRALALSSSQGAGLRESWEWSSSSLCVCVMYSTPDIPINPPQ